MTDETSPTAAAKPNGMTIPLSRPLTVHGKNGIEQISELKLRDPTADDVLDLGDVTRRIYSSDGMNVETKVDGQALRAWIIALSGHDRGVVGRMDAADIRKCYDAIVLRLVDAGN